MKAVMKTTIPALLAILAVSSPVAAQVPDKATASTSGIKRQVLIDERSAQVARVTYFPGTIEPPGPHAFDVVIVPLSEGTMRFSIAGKDMPPWSVGSAFFVPRQTEHVLANVGSTSVEFITIRIP